MRHLLTGFKISLLFGIVSIVLMLIASFIGLKSPWWPLYWPSYIFLIVGYPSIYLIDSFPRVASILSPRGGAPGVFLIVCEAAFIIWGLVFSLLVWRRFLPFVNFLKAIKMS
jgi:hypothetical protein